MPIPIPPPSQPSTTGTSKVQPYHLRARQDFAVEQERQRHSEALYHVGEFAIFVLMWKLLDFKGGLVERCSVCYGAPDSEQERLAKVYNQATQKKCPNCFGTTFEGGYRARIIRPAIFSETDESEKPEQRRGTIHPSNVTLDTTADFQLMEGDYVIRGDNSRWRCRTPQDTTLRTGFEFPYQTKTSVAYNRVRADFEEPSTVAFLLPPTSEINVREYCAADGFWPGSHDLYEDIRGPLIPPSGLHD